MFGSNTGGHHGAGAARFAMEALGAEYGVGEGRTGRCYALPTLDSSLRKLPSPVLAEHVERFLKHAEEAMEATFFLSQVGCGLAGLYPELVAPMFSAAPVNVVIPLDFEVVIQRLIGKRQTRDVTWDYS